MGSRTGALTTAAGKWCRSGEFDCCTSCGTSERPHSALGYCERCYSVHDYHRNRDDEVRRRKLKRLRWTDDRQQAEYERQKAWKAANRERALAKQREFYWRNRARLRKWNEGDTVYFEFLLSVWIKGTIVEAARHYAIVQFATFSQKVGYRRLRKEQPTEAAA